MGYVQISINSGKYKVHGIGIMTNNMEEAEELVDEHGYNLPNILGITRTVKKGWKKLHTTFGGFGFRNLATEQLIEILNLLLQHYSAFTPIRDMRPWDTYNYNLAPTNALWTYIPYI